jgi:hypothetical protein
VTGIAHLLPPPVNGNAGNIELGFPGTWPYIYGDAILWRIWNLPQVRLPKTSIVVGLRIDTPGEWAKEVTGWTTCQCTVETDHVESAAPGYSLMRINRSTVDTVAFRKAVFLGWHNCGFFGPTSQVVWDLLGGFVLTFDWIIDNLRPPPP